MTDAPPPLGPPRVAKDSNEALSCLLVAVPGALVIWGIWTLGAQAIEYLKTGMWVSPSVIDFLAQHDVQWAIAPTSWIGVHHMLQGCALWAGQLLGGLLLLWLMSAVSDSAMKKT